LKFVLELRTSIWILETYALAFFYGGWGFYGSDSECKQSAIMTLPYKAVSVLNVILLVLCHLAF